MLTKSRDTFEPVSRDLNRCTGKKSSRFRDLPIPIRKQLHWIGREFVKFAEPLEQLAWLLSFAQREDLRRLNPAERRKIERELYAFCVARGAQAIAEHLLRRKALASLADHTGRVLRKLARKQSYTIRLNGIDWTVRSYRGTNSFESMYAGNFSALWPFVINEVAVGQAGKIRECLAQRCRRLFISDGRKKYCSERCGSGDRTRRHRRNRSPAELKLRYKLQYARELVRKGKVATARVYCRREGIDLPTSARKVGRRSR